MVTLNWFLGLWATCCLVLIRVIHQGSAGDARGQGPRGLGLLTGCLHHAGPEPGLLVQRVVVGAAELVDVHAGWRTHAAIVADEHVEVLWAGWGAETAGCLPLPPLCRRLPHYLHLHQLPTVHTLCGVFARVTLLLPPPLP